MTRVSILFFCLVLSTSSLFANNTFNTPTEETSDEGDTRMKIRLEFNSINTYTRLINVLADENATIGFDSEYDSELENIQADDMYWLIDSGKYISQGIDEINIDTVIPLGINTSTTGLNTISINKLENIPNSMKIFIYDSELAIYHSLKEGAYEVDLNAGMYLNRFEIVFVQPDTLGVSEFQNQDIALDIMFDRFSDQIKILNHSNLKIETVEVYSILGQAVHRSNASNANNQININANQIRTGAYVVIVKSENGINSKKILVN
ncbi:hypothetical protein A9Q86_04730 [Flavobacteriales bacterium 33_180_T64]|nr:hypothetical protein A9Q86_04730 [Flavobacteriales bacterium 33_180_T64]